MGIINKTTQEVDDILKFQKGIPSGGDAGVQFTSPILKNVIIGNYDNPVELCVGQGDSTTETMIAYHTSDDVTFTDITDILTSDSGSSTGLFGGTAIGSTIYVGMDWKFSGTKTTIVTAGSGLHGNFTSEYWDGTIWQHVDVMTVNSTFDIFSSSNQRADNIATIDGISEQWYFDLDPYSQTPVWQQSTINGVTKFWARMRIVNNAITTDPIIEHLKGHTNRVEIENVGIFRYGAARYPRILNNGLSNTVKNTVIDPRNEPVSYTPSIIAGYVDNEFQNGVDDGFLYVQNLEDGIDTSTKYKLKIAYYVKGTNTGDINLLADVVLVGQNVGNAGPFVYDGTAPSTEYSFVDTVSVDSNLIRRTAEFYIDISHLTPADAMVINIHRDATSATDTLGASVIMTHVVPTAYFWKD